MVDEKYIEKIRKDYFKASQYARAKGYTNNELEEKQDNNEELLAKRRGYILNRMSEIEHQLNLFLARYFTPAPDITLHGTFYDLVLGKDFFTLHQKIKLFGELKFHKDKEFKNVFDGLTGVLHELKDMRNIMAHGHKAHYTEPTMTFLGSHKSKNIDEIFMRKFNKNFEIAFFSLAELNDFLNKERFGEAFS